MDFLNVSSSGFNNRTPEGVARVILEIIANDKRVVGKSDSAEQNLFELALLYGSSTSDFSSLVDGVAKYVLETFPNKIETKEIEKGEESKTTYQ